MPQAKLECSHAQTFTCIIITLILFLLICQKIVNYIPIQEQHTDIKYGIPNPQCELSSHCFSNHLGAVRNPYQAMDVAPCYTIVCLL